jgi:hypothetical protein
VALAKSSAALQLDGNQIDSFTLKVWLDKSHHFSQFTAGRV